MKKIPFLVFAACCLLSQRPGFCLEDTYTFDFGRVQEGREVRYDFPLKNDLGRTIKIISVESSCGCTVSQAKKKILLPGESTLIEVKFNSKGYFGPVAQYVYVETDRLDKQIIKLIIKAEVVK